MGKVGYYGDYGIYYKHEYSANLAFYNGRCDISFTVTTFDAWGGAHYNFCNRSLDLPKTNNSTTTYQYNNAQNAYDRQRSNDNFIRNVLEINGQMVKSFRF